MCGARFHKGHILVESSTLSDFHATQEYLMLIYRNSCGRDVCHALHSYILVPSAALTYAPNALSAAL